MSSNVIDIGTRKPLTVSEPEDFGGEEAPMTEGEQRAYWSGYREGGEDEQRRQQEEIAAALEQVRLLRPRLTFA